MERFVLLRPPYSPDLAPTDFLSCSCKMNESVGGLEDENVLKKSEILELATWSARALFVYLFRSEAIKLICFRGRSTESIWAGEGESHRRGELNGQLL
jgi:hypothetical protein